MAVLSWCRAIGLGTLLVGVAATNVQANTQDKDRDIVSTTAVQQALKQSSIPFIKNQGQKHHDVAFYTTMPGGALFVDNKGGLVYALRNEKQVWAFKESFVREGAVALNPHETVKSTLQLRMQDKDGVHELVAADTVSLGEIAKGIRVELQAASSNVEKLFYVAPGAIPQLIRVKLEGIKASRIDAQGQLVIDTGLASSRKSIRSRRSRRSWTVTRSCRWPKPLSWATSSAR